MGTSNVSMKMSQTKRCVPYVVEESTRFRSPLQRDHLGHGYDPQVGDEFSGAGCHNERTLGQFCRQVSCFRTLPEDGDLRERTL
jgi:hypothetical protein